MFISNVLVLAAAATFAAASPAGFPVNITSRDNFANFFDDDNCQVNGGIGVDLNNPGCLAERGRGSVYIPNNGWGSSDVNQYCMVKTKDSDQYNCQNEGWNFTPTGFCAKLDSSFGSYRFINQPCDPTTAGYAKELMHRPQTRTILVLPENCLT
ncbi:hypothetical protein BKA62DRAFT_833246 [Auriculariales sp. MPI-PUGE-AT-0066]|nr:hypothetical protein BKA62DRAFT_833246 [Auriculariales sp. MPI-PUGE-AT-0066]